MQSQSSISKRKLKSSLVKKPSPKETIVPPHSPNPSMIATGNDDDLTPERKLWRQELLQEIEKDGLKTASISPPSPEEVPAAVTPVATNLKKRWQQRQIKRYRWLWIPLLAMVIYSIFYILRLDRLYPPLTRYLPWPAAIVNGHIIWLDELNARAALLDGFNEDQMKERLAFNNLVEDQLINDSLQQYNLSVPEELLNQQLAELSSKFANQQAFQNYLQTQYALNLNVFVNDILQPYLKRLILQKYLAADPQALAQAEAKAQHLREQLLAGELTFAEAAKAYSDDRLSAEQGGSLGWFMWGSMLPEFEASLRTLKVGEISQPILSNYGYHLIRLDEIDGPRPTNHSDSNGALGNVRISHIFILTASFNDWLQQQKISSPPLLLIPLKN